MYCFNWSVKLESLQSRERTAQLNEHLSIRTWSTSEEKVSKIRVSAVMRVHISIGDKRSSAPELVVPHWVRHSRYTRCQICPGPTNITTGHRHNGGCPAVFPLDDIMSLGRSADKRRQGNANVQCIQGSDNRLLQKSA